MSQDWDAGRLDSDLEGVAFDTLAVRAGQHRTPEGEHGDQSTAKRVTSRSLASSICRVTR